MCVGKYTGRDKSCLMCERSAAVQPQPGTDWRSLTMLELEEWREGGKEGHYAVFRKHSQQTLVAKKGAVNEVKKNRW